MVVYNGDSAPGWSYRNRIIRKGNAERERESEREHSKL
jgi:hypothetical protein